MAKFEFYEDTRIVSWNRKYYEVEAETYSEAVAKIENAYNLDDLEFKGGAVCTGEEEDPRETTADSYIYNEDGEQIL